MLSKNRIKLYLILGGAALLVFGLIFLILKVNTRSITLSSGYTVSFMGKLDGGEAEKLYTHCKDVLYPAAATDKNAREQIEEALALIIQDSGEWADEALLLRSQTRLYAGEIEKAVDDLTEINKKYANGSLIKQGDFYVFCTSLIETLVGKSGHYARTIPLYQVLRVESILKKANDPNDIQARTVIDGMLNDQSLLAGITAETMGTPDNTRTSDLTAKEDAATQARFNAQDQLPKTIASQISARVDLSNIIPNGDEELINWVRDHLEIKIQEVKAEEAKENEPKPGDIIINEEEKPQAKPKNQDLKPVTPEEIAAEKLKVQFESSKESKFNASAKAIATLKGKNLTLGDLLRQCAVADVYSLVKEQ